MDMQELGELFSWRQRSARIEVTAKGLEQALKPKKTKAVLVLVGGQTLKKAFEPKCLKHESKKSEADAQQRPKFISEFVGGKRRKTAFETPPAHKEPPVVQGGLPGLGKRR